MDECCKQRVEQAERRQSNANAIDSQSAAKILHDDATASTGNPDRVHQSEQIVSDQHNVGALACDFGARSHRDADRCLHECWRVVNAIAHHGNLFSIADELLNDCVLLIRQNFGINFVDSDLFGDRVGNRSGVTGQQHSFQSHGVQSADRIASLWSKCIRNPDGSDILAVRGNQYLRRVVGTRGMSTKVNLFLLKECPASCQYFKVIERAGDTCTGNVLELFRCRYSQPGFRCSTDNGLAQGMFGPLLGNRRKLQNLLHLCDLVRRRST